MKKTTNVGFNYSEDELEMMKRAIISSIKFMESYGGKINKSIEKEEPEVKKEKVFLSRKQACSTYKIKVSTLERLAVCGKVERRYTTKLRKNGKFDYEYSEEDIKNYIENDRRGNKG